MNRTVQEVIDTTTIVNDPSNVTQGNTTTSNNNNTDSWIANPQFAVLLLNSVAILWGSQHAIIKTVVTDDDTTTSAAVFTLCRFALAALVALPAGMSEVLWWTKDTSEESSSSASSKELIDSESLTTLVRWGTEMGLWMFLGFAFQAIGLETTTAQKSGFLLYLNVKFVPFFAWLGYGRQISLSTWLSAATAVLGTTLMAGFFTTFGSESAIVLSDAQRWNVGDVWSLLAAAASAMFILRLESASQALPQMPAALNAASLVMVTILATSWTFLSESGNFEETGTNLDWITLSNTFSQHIWEFLYLGIVTTAVANWIQTSAQRFVSAERASLIYAMDPVYGAAFSYAWLGETLPGVAGWIGATLIATAAASNAWLEWDKTESVWEKTTNSLSKSNTTSLLDNFPRGGAESDGGSTSTVDENEEAELDAYVHQLLEDDTEECGSWKHKETDTNTTTTRNSAKPIDPPIPSSETQEEKQNATKTENATDKTKARSIKNRKRTKVKQSTSKVKTASMSEEEPAMSKNDGETVASTENQTAPLLVTRPSRPPRGLVRFLLQSFSGLGGRSLAMFLISCTEFCHNYLPPLAYTGDWVWDRLFPSTSYGSGRRSRQYSTSMDAAYINRLAKTGVSRGKRRKLTKKADQEALRQLRQRPSSELRYTFCSSDFLRRHGLGKFAYLRKQSLVDATQLESKGAPISSAVESDIDIPQETRTVRRKKKKQDWVLMALSKKPRKTQSSDGNFPLGTGSNGLSIGFEFNWASQQARIREVLAVPSMSSSKNALKNGSTPRKSDADGGVVGRLRAAAGSSIRSLSGAYPGDALGVEEAGNPFGLTDFATRYGYGEWADSDEEFHNNHSKRRGKTRKRRRRRKDAGMESQNDFGIPTFDSSSQDFGHT
jgi:drug/metabolite transporter (DMT)-like permease